MSKNESLSSKQRRALHALLIQPTIAGAAVYCGVAESTLYRWLADADFHAALAEAEGLAIDAAARRLVGLTETAIETLACVLVDPQVAVAVRLRAVEAVLANMLRLRELGTLEQRLAKLEEAYHEQFD